MSSSHLLIGFVLGYSSEAYVSGLCCGCISVFSAGGQGILPRHMSDNLVFGLMIISVLVSFFSYFVR